MKSYIFIFCAVVLTLHSCKKAEKYYHKLDDQPEIYKDYGLAYGVDDTLTIRGRLNPDNLTVSIGGIKANLLSVYSQGKPANGNGIEEVKIIITEQMGIGENRAISITSSGNTIDAPSIEIYEGDKSGMLQNPLKTVTHASMPFSSIPIYCRSGKGTVYLWNADKTITRISKDGAMETVLTESNLIDGNGQFKISAFYSGGIDPTEKYLYFSVLTTDNSPDNASNAIYRLCRYDLQNNQLTTLNRTLYSHIADQRTFAAAQPFEGTISQVKAYHITDLYPDNNGNVYLIISKWALAKLSSDGNFNYLFKGFNQPNVAFVPQTWNLQTGSYHGENDLGTIRNSLPGLQFEEGISFVNISPDEKLFYGRSYNGSVLVQFDLINRVETHRFADNSISFTGLVARHKPYISGSFGILTGYEVNSDLPGQFGCFPLPGEKLLILYYQSVATRPDKPYYSQYPAWGILDYKARRGYRYAPEKFERGSYRMTKTDQILNTDEDGMVYMTANNNTSIIKTQYK